MSTGGAVAVGEGAVAVSGSLDMVMSFAAAATLVPFLQALSGAVGTKVATRLDDATRRTVRRVLRRELRRFDQRSTRALGTLATTGGTQIRFEAHTPEDALPQLLAMTFETIERPAPDVPALVRWTPAGWLATVSRSGQLHDLHWDPEQVAWISTTPPSGRPGPPPTAGPRPADPRT
ncbi:hypothetical protein ACFP51_32655 [Streptomyces pratens]|uniref:ABC transmembrane type-1 domain-containing protein n=1 Tax=Streptomyces pratens TaxID=887456 RepID=A0ABW1MBS5_9ACTN